jgi:hypothetical protein
MAHHVVVIREQHSDAAGSICSAHGGIGTELQARGSPKGNTFRAKLTCGYFEETAGNDALSQP